MNSKKDHSNYSAEETQQRLEAALRGARIAGPKHNESLTPKRPKKQRKVKIKNR
jgi:hypothetical protein